jgi:hypothetical protein
VEGSGKPRLETLIARCTAQRPGKVCIKMPAPRAMTVTLPGTIVVGSWHKADEVIPAPLTSTKFHPPSSMRTRAADRLLLGMRAAAPEEAAGTSTGCAVRPGPEPGGRSNAIRPQGSSLHTPPWEPAVVG